MGAEAAQSCKAQGSAAASSKDAARLEEHRSSTGGAKIIPMPVPSAPTAEERARHDVDHCPYQAWCRSCVAGRGKADAHFARESDDSGVACVACDYAFMGEKVEDEKLSSKCLPILVHKFYKDRWVTSHVVPKKGEDSYAVKQAARDLEQSGLQNFIYKSDGERSIGLEGRNGPIIARKCW